MRACVDRAAAPLDPIERRLRDLLSSSGRYDPGSLSRVVTKMSLAMLSWPGERPK
jgi:hypothetical protein